MTKLKAFIIDDEPDSVQLLQLQLKQYCPFFESVHTCTDPVQALIDIKRLKPDLVFLDIEMPVLNGFQLLEQLSPVEFGVIFVTAFNHYAIKAFKFNAIDYIVKPADTTELNQAISKALSAKPSAQQLNLVQRQMNGELPQKIALHTLSGISFIELNEIIYAEASDNYTKLIMTGGKQHLVSKTLKDVQEVLEESHFFRIHRQYLINLNHVKHYSKSEGTLTMADKAELPVARNQKEKLISKYGWL